MTRSRRTASIALIALLASGPAWGQNPPAQPPGVPPPTAQPVLDFNRAISSDLETKAGAVTGRTTETGTVEVMGEILVRDTYVTQLTQFGKNLETLRGDKAALTKTLQELRVQAGPLEDAYQNMLATEQDIHRFEGSHSRVDLSQIHDDQVEEAARADRLADAAAAAGNAGAAEYWRDEAAKKRTAADDSLYGLYLRRRQYFFQLLDQNPMLGLGEHNVVMPDKYLFHELMNTLPGTHMDTFVDFIDGAIEEAQDEATRAAAVNTEEDLVEFGGPKYQRQRETIAETGTALGTPFPGQLADAAAGRYEQVEGDSAVMNAGIDLTLGVIAAGSAIIPGVGPLISATTAAVMVVRSGNELVVSVLDEQQAAKLGGVTGYVRLLTAEDRAAAAAGNFVMTVAGAMLDGANAVRVVRGAPAAAAVDAVEGVAGAAARPGAGAAGAVDVPPPIPPRTATTGGSGGPATAGPPRSAGAGPAAAPGAETAPLATRPTPRSAGTIDETIQRARESATRNGINPQQVEDMTGYAKSDFVGNRNPRFTGRLDNPMVEANSFLGEVADLDLTRQRALASGLPAGEVDAIIKRAVDSANNGGGPEAFRQMRRELAVSQLNQNGFTVFVDPAFASEFDDIAVAATSRVNQGAADLVRLNTRVILASTGRLSDALTAQELALLADLMARGDDIYKWIDFGPGNSFEPIFTKDFLDRVHRMYPDGIPAPPRVATGTGTAAGAVDAAPVGVAPGGRAVEPTPIAPSGAADDAPTNLGGGRGNNNQVPPSGAPDDTPTNIGGNRAPAQPVGSTTPIDPGITTIDPSQTVMAPNGTVLNPAAFVPPAVVGGAVTVGAAGMSTASAAEGTGGVDPGNDIATTLPGITFSIGPPPERGEPNRTSLGFGGTAVEDGGDLAHLGGDPSGCCTPGVQVLSLDFGEPATVNPTTQTREDAALRLSLPRMAENALSMLKFIVRGTSQTAASRTLAFANQPIGMPPAFGGPALEALRSNEGGQATAGNPIQTFLVANGHSQGEAFDMQIVNTGSKPVKVFGAGVVIEPIKKELQQIARQQMQKLIGSGANVLTRKVEAYCLQYALAPPSPGMLFQIAGPALQDKFKPAGMIMNAARHLASAGALNPDSNPKAYLDSIKQYAIWTRFENWDMKKFGDVLLDKTKTAAAAAKSNWTGQMQAALMSAVPGRWRDIQTVLSAAQELAARPGQ